MVRIVIPGEAKGKARPRFNTKTGRTFTTKDTIQYENLVKICYMEQCIDHEGYTENPVRADLRVYTSIPKSFSKKKRQEALRGVLRPSKKPDLDNIAKAILDSLNGVVYKDDSQIVELSIVKYYDEIPRVEVWIGELLNE